MRSGNPALNENVFSDAGRVSLQDSMTIEGTVNKTALTLMITMAAAGYVWNRFFTGQPVHGLMLGGMLGGLVVALITIFKKTAAPVTTPLYGALEGLVLGGLSATLETRYPGIVIQAVGLTFGALFALLAAYKSKLISVTDNFRLGVASATGAIALVYLVGIGLSFFGVRIPLIHESGPVGILFSLFVVAVASFNLVLDFDFIERGAQSGAPKYMEWYGAFGLLVTLVWLYLEILRLLAKLQDRRR